MKPRPYARILIEGMDGTGKTTLTEQLMEYLGDRGVLIPGYNRDPDRNLFSMPMWWMDKLSHNPIDRVVVHDRFFYPELVYGPILRGKILGSPGQRTYVRGFLRAHAFLIYCRPSNEVVLKGLESNEQMEGVKSRFDDLLVEYDKLMIEEGPYYNGRFMRYDWTDTVAYQKLLLAIASYIYQ